MFIPTRQVQLHSVLIFALSLSLAGILSSQNSSAQTSAYTVIEIALAGEIPTRLNNLGDVVGRGGGSGQAQAMFWTRGNMQAKRLGALLGGDYSSASAINDAGEITGLSNTATSVVPFIWKPKGGWQQIPLLPGDNGGQGLGINKSGDVVGYSSGPNGTRAFRWARREGIRNLGCLPGGNYSRARAVNDSAQVVGMSASPAGDRAILWTKDGQVRDLGTLPGDTASEAIAINNAGAVVGYSKGSGGLRAFLWTAATGMQNVGALPGGNASRALDINDAGCVVGSSSSSSGDHAFIWTKQDGMTDLNSAASAALGVVFVEAHAINNAGQILILGKAMPDGDSSRATVHSEHDCAVSPATAFLLTPAPAK
jgi:probable HAF family extracellular repeat protein